MDKESRDYAEAQLRRLIEREMDKLMTRPCPECGIPAVFDILGSDYLCNKCRADLEKQSKGC